MQDSASTTIRAFHACRNARWRALAVKAIAVWVLLYLCGACQRSEAPEQGPEPDIETQRASAEDKAAVLEQKVVDGAMMVPKDFDLIRKPEAQAVDPTGREPLDDTLTCLARTIYWEARGESAASMESVANVVVNRLAYDGFPRTICAVVKQGQEQGACQFSWWCDGRSDAAFEDDAYAVAKEVARKALNRQLTDRTDGALYFHHRNVSPAWASTFIKTAEVGDLVFYKPES
jgi:spore germination cell wall hydrolase CwlJ-like protein